MSRVRECFLYCKRSPRVWNPCVLNCSHLLKATVFVSPIDVYTLPTQWQIYKLFCHRLHWDLMKCSLRYRTAKQCATHDVRTAIRFAPESGVANVYAFLRKSHQFSQIAISPLLGELGGRLSLRVACFIMLPCFEVLVLAYGHCGSFHLQFTATAHVSQVHYQRCKHYHRMCLHLNLMNCFSTMALRAAVRHV